MMWRCALLLLFAARSWACSCSGTWPSVKQAWKNAPAVFVGTVELANPDGDGRQMMFQDQLVRIRVDEAFKGVFAGQTIELHQGADDCSAKFKTGERAVFYLYPGRVDSWIVPWCTRATGIAEPAGDDLLFLHGLPKSALGTRLSGEVELYEDSPEQAFRRAGGLPNVRVAISDSKGHIHEVLTNASGVYELYGLPPERYSVSIQVPRGLKIKFPSVSGSSPVRGHDTSVDLESEGGASVDFVLMADTELSGRILNSKGEPVKDVCIDLDPIQGRGEDGARFFACSKARGVFKMTMMPPGKYRLVAQDEVRLDGVKSESTLYYPGVRDRNRATIISIEASHYLENLDIKLPSDEKRYKITGQFRYADGVPVTRATVRFTSPQSGYSETTSSSVDGSFGLSIVAGMEGQLTGQLGILEPMLRSCPEFRVEPRRSGLMRFMDANPISLLADANHDNLILALASPSCKPSPPIRK